MQHRAHLFPAPEGLILAGTIIAKRNPDGTFAVAGHEEEIQALLSAAYGKSVPPQAMHYIKRSCEVLSQASGEELERIAYPYFPNPHAHASNNFSPLTKGLMMLALSGLNALDDVPAGKARLAKMRAALASGESSALLKSFGLLKVDGEDDGGDGGDDESDDESGDNFSFGDDGTDSEGDSGDSDFDAKHPRWPAGAPDSTGGEFRPKDGSDTPASDSPEEASLFDVSRSREGDSSQSGPFDISMQEFLDYPTDPIYATHDDGTVIRDPLTQIPILIPPGVSLNDNVDFGRSIANLPSIITGSALSDDAAKEAAMADKFRPGGTMDYQRVYSDQTDSQGNALVNPSYIDIGNYNYGIVAAAAGYTLEQALNAGALVNIRNITNPNVGMVLNPFSVTDTQPLFSNPRVNRFVTLGYQDYRAGKIKGSNEQ